MWESRLLAIIEMRSVMLLVDSSSGMLLGYAIYTINVHKTGIISYIL